MHRRLLLTPSLVAIVLAAACGTGDESAAPGSPATTAFPSSPSTVPSTAGNPTTVARQGAGWVGYDPDEPWEGDAGASDGASSFVDEEKVYSPDAAYAGDPAGAPTTAAAATSAG